MNAELGRTSGVAVSRPFLESREPFVVTPSEIGEIAGARPRDVPLAVAPLCVSGGRLGAIVAAGSAPGHDFPELKLRILGGLADQATLAIASAH